MRAQRLGELDGGLPAESDDHAHGLLDLHHVQHVFLGERLEIQSVGGIEIRGNGFRVVVDDRHVVAHCLQRPHTVHGGIVELDALADADRAGTEHHHAGLIRLALAGFAHIVVGRIEIGRERAELRAAGVHHLIDRAAVRGQRVTADARERLVREAQALHLKIRLFVERPGGDFLLRAGQAADGAEEETVNARGLINLLDGHAVLQRLIHGEQAHIIHLVIIQLARASERVYANFRAADGLHQSHFQRGRDGHHLARCLHLRAQRVAGAHEFVKWETRQLDHHIVHSRFKTGAGFARHIVDDLIQRKSHGDLRGDLGNGITRGLARQGGRAGQARIDLDHGVLEAVGIQGKLAVASALDAQRADDAQRGSAQHLQFLVRQGERGRDNNRVARVHAYGIDVFHGAHGDGVARRIAQRLELDFLPAIDVLFDQRLVDGRKREPRLGHFAQRGLVVCHAAARAAQRERGPHDHRIADLPRHGHGLFHARSDARRDDRLADFAHGFSKELAVFGLVDGRRAGAQQAHAVRF